MFPTVGHDLTYISPGLYILFVLGPAQNLTNFIIQCLGIAASLLSVVKGVAEYHLFTRFNEIKVFMEKRIQFHSSDQILPLPSSPHSLPVVLHLGYRRLRWLLRPHPLLHHVHHQHDPHLCLLTSLKSSSNYFSSHLLSCPLCVQSHCVL